MIQDVSPLHTLDPAIWRALGARLRALDLAHAHSDVVAVAEEFPDAVARPLRVWHLRQARDTHAYAMRLLLDDPLAEDEMVSVLGDVPLKPLLDVGLFARDAEGRIALRFSLRYADDVLVFADDLEQGGEVVMGFGRMTVAVARAAYPTRRVSRALDLGCGAGACAMLLAKTADHVVATDISDRAVALTKINVLVNGLENVTVLQGDMYAPVAGQKFDVVVSQPPFVPMPEGASHTTYLYGGRRGDELPLRAIAELPPYLAPGGRAVFFIVWPVVERDTIDARVRGALGADPANVLLVKAPGMTVDSYSIAAGLEFSEMAVAEAGDPQSFARKQAAMRCIRYREHLGRLGVVGVQEAFTVIERGDRAKGWTASVDLGDLQELKISGAHLTALVAAQDRVARGASALLGSRLRLPKGTEVARGEDGATLLFPKDWFLDRVKLDGAAAKLVLFAHESPNVRQAIDRYAKAMRVPSSGVTDQAVGVLGQAVSGGVLRAVD